MLTAPRVYFAMAQDGLFFKQVGMVHPRTRAPIVAIALQGLLAIVIALARNLRSHSQLRRLGRRDFLRPDCVLYFRISQTAVRRLHDRNHAGARSSVDDDRIHRRLLCWW